MSYTSPTTRSTGNTISAANWNTDNVDNIKWLAGDSGGKPSCRVYNSANIAVTTGTTTALTFNSELWDNGGLHSTVSNTSRITVPSGGGGIWMVGGHVQWEINATGVRNLGLRTNATGVYGWQTCLAIAGSNILLSVCTMLALVPTDYIELIVLQNSGGNLNVEAAAGFSPEFWAMWVAV